MARQAVPPSATDDEVRRLLDRYKCPVPFHVVRTRFLGNIASPGIAESPMKAVSALWGGELPEFESLDAANELIAALVMGLWNRLTRLEVSATREGLAKLASLRHEELEGFVEGLFGANESLDLPERAHKAMDVLANIRAMLEASWELARDPTKPADPAEVAVTLGHFRELTRIAEHEMHEAVLSCTRARRQMMHRSPATKPVLH